MAFQISELESQDYESFSSLFRQLANTRSFSRDKFETTLRHNAKSGSCLFAAKGSNGQVLGTAKICVIETFGSPKAYLEDLVVDQEWRLKGVGSALIRHVVEEARRRGCYTCNVVTYDDLVGFYERYGFRKDREILRIELR